MALAVHGEPLARLTADLPTSLIQRKMHTRHMVAKVSGVTDQFPIGRYDGRLYVIALTQEPERRETRRATLLLAARRLHEGNKWQRNPSSGSAGIDLRPGRAVSPGTARKAELRPAVAPSLAAGSTLPGRALID